jgi:hypothetical protein
MKTIHALFIALFAIPFVDAGPIKVGDTNVTFEPPKGFKPVPQEIIDVKWPSKRAPKFVVGNETASTTVAYDLKPNVIPQDKLGEVQKTFTQLFGRIIPGLEWKKNQIIEHSGRKWLFMEMTSKAIDTDIYNIMMMTGYDNRMLIFNFNSTKEDFPKFEKALRASLASIKIPEANKSEQGNR